MCDTGATSSVGTLTDPFDHTNQLSGKIFSLPAGGTTAATTIAKLRINVREPAKTIDIVPNLVQTLISGGKFADAGYKQLYDADGVKFYNNTAKITISEEAVIRGYRDKSGLWRIPLQTFVINEKTDTLLLDAPSKLQSLNCMYQVPDTIRIRNHIQASNQKHRETINNVYELPSIKEAIRYLHGAAGYPVKATWLKAIRCGNYDTWPLITVNRVNKYFPESEETQQGHMRGQRQGIRSTKTKIKIENDDTTSTEPLKTLNDIVIKVHDTTDTIFTDQTGKFPHLSSRGNRYQMILYHVDSNSIWVEPMKNRTEGEMIKARALALGRMKLCNIQPKRQVLDNEASAEFKTAIKESGMDYQLVPPDDHRRNVAEKAIQTWKDHFVAVLSGTANDFPLHLWCQCIPQMELQLHLLRQSNANPKISTYAHLFGPHNYNATPFVPIGMTSMIHDKPNRRKTFDQHCTKGWVLGTSLEHYRCWKMWNKTTRATRISGTVFFKHKYITNPNVSPADAIVAATTNLTNAINGNLTQQHKDQIKLAQLRSLQNIVTDMSTITKPTQIATPPREPLATPPRVAQKTTKAPPNTNPAPTPRVDTSPPIEFEYMDTTPAENTRSTRQIRTITQETMLAAIDVFQLTVTAKATSTRRYPKEMLAAVLNEETGELMEYRHLIANPKYRKIWKPAYGKEIGRLAQGIPGVVDGTNTMIFIDKSQVPSDRWRDVTYGRICANFRPEKDDPNRIRLTVGGNNINFPGDCGTPTCSMLTVKILLNSVVSTPGAKFMTIDIKDFYLMTPMPRPEYMRLKMDDMPEDIIELYNLRNIVNKDGYVFVKIQKGMYGLPQAGILAQELLEKRLNANGYRQSKLTPGFWTHDWRPISFTLCVDDFGVKYVGKEHAQHLLASINQHYKTSHEWEGTRYIGLTLDWDYIQRLVHISMPGYCEKACTRFQHERPRKPQDQPYPHIEPTYGSKKQYAEEADTSSPLSKANKTYVQEVVGVFLYYARAVDCTMLAALGSIATQQSNPTENTMAKVQQLLDYAATHPDAIITYRASDMILAAHSDASYLSESKARSRAGGHFFLSENDTFPSNNGAVLTVAQIIKAVMSSAAEAELGALYINSREAIPQRHLLEEMGHPQPPTPIQIDNTTALGVVTNTIQPKRTKAMDMRFHWLRDRENQGQFRTYWREGKTNLGDYVTKHHAAIHHRTVRSLYLTAIGNALRRKATGIINKLMPTARVC